MTRWVSGLDRMLRAAALALLLVMAGETATALIPQPPAAMATIAYNNHHYSAFGSDPAAERGPPAASDPGATHDLVGHRSHSDPARSGRDATPGIYTYDNSARFVQFARPSTMTSGDAGDTDGDLCGLQRWQFAANAAGDASTVLMRTPVQLQKKFKHAGDFGVTGNYAATNAARFSAAMHQHMNAAGTQRIVGTYRNASAAHYLDPKTGLNVVSDLDGNFITGFRLGSGQLNDVLTTGRLW